MPDEKPDGDLHRPGFFPIFDVPYRRVPRSPYLYENRTNENRAVCRTARLARCAGPLCHPVPSRGVAAYAPDAYSLHAVHQPAGYPLRVAQAWVVAQRTARCSHAAGDVRPVSLAGIPGAARRGVRGEFVGAGRVLLRGTGDRVCLGRAGARLVGKAQTAAL